MVQFLPTKLLQTTHAKLKRPFFNCFCDSVMIAIGCHVLCAFFQFIDGISHCNTGSGKSNTLCRIFTDCLCQRTCQEASVFSFIDFNNEYTSDSVLSRDKAVYRLDTRNGGDRIPVSSDFYFDVDMWAMLSKATEKTQRLF